MNISSVLGLHGWLHVIMFAVIAVLIKRCAEMQQLPTMMRGGHEETGTETVETGTLPGMQPGTDEGLDTGLPKGPDTGMDTQERGFPTGTADRQTSEKSNGDLINSIGADTNLDAIGDAHGDTLRDAQGNFHGDSDTNGFTNGDSDGETASWDSYTASPYSSQNEWSAGSFSDLGTRSTVYSGRDEFTEYTGSAVYGGGETSSSLTSSSLTAKNEGTRSLQEDWERTTYCATESRNAGQSSNRDSARDVSRDVARDSTIGGSHRASSQAIYTESHLDLEDDITMLTSDATAMGEDTGNDLELDSDLGGLDLLSKASTFIIDSTVGTFMQMTQAYMQDEYSAPRKEEPPDNHAIDKEGSSVWCWGTHHSQRLCRFRNLCYLPEHDDFVFFHSPNSVISGLPHDRFSPTLLDISSVHDHNGQYFNYVDLPASQAAGLDIEMIPATSLIYRRFNPDNLMHVIHDDLLPMYFTLHMISRNGTGGESLPFDVNLVLIENWTPGDYVNLYQVFSPYKLMLRTELEAKTKLTCFADVYVGVTKSTTWYQYGFREPQGPIPGYSVTAHEIRMFTNYLKDRLETHSITVPNGQDYVVLLTRKHNRLILNEVELTLALVTQLRVKVITLGVETHSIAEMVAILSKATVLIGMHGSLLSLAMFLHPGAILVELFPYAVNPEHYTPYKTLTKLPGMNIMYKSWRNMDSAKTVAHPDRGWDTGGINHLPKEEQDHILQSSEVPRHLCCRDAEWLYRIYQDTIVDTDALVKLVAGAMEEQSQNLQNGQKTAPVARHHRLHPGSVSEIKCTDPKEQVPSSLQSMTPPSINLSWQPPWNAQYLNPLSVKYEVWIQEQNQDQYTAWILSRTTYSFSSGLKPQTNYSVWVRCILNDMVHGPFNKDHVSCST